MSSGQEVLAILSRDLRQRKRRQPHVLWKPEVPSWMPPELPCSRKFNGKTSDTCQFRNFGSHGIYNSVTPGTDPNTNHCATESQQATGTGAFSATMPV